MTKVLAVEDEALVRMLLVETLEDAGYTVLEAADGEAALSIIQGDPDIAIIVTDIRMPKLDGFGLAMAAKQIRPNLSLLFMTGYSGSAVPRELSTVSILQKPFAPGELLAAVQSILS